MNIGRWRRAFSARSTAPRPMIGSELAVHEITASNSCSRAGRSARRMASAPKRAASFSPRSSVRLATAMRFGVRAAKWVATSSIISPAPTNSTLISAQVLEQLRGQPHRGGGHADRMGADLGEVRTSLATAKERWNSWCSVVPSVPASRPRAPPASSGRGSAARPAPSNRGPLATRKAWRAAAPSFHHIGVRLQRAAADAAHAGQPVDRRAHQPRCASGAATYSSVRLQVDTRAASGSTALQRARATPAASAPTARA